MLDQYIAGGGPGGWGGGGVGGAGVAWSMGENTVNIQATIL